MLATSDRLVVCRLGSQGADLYTEAGMLHHCPALDVPVVDTLGAGDAYNAGFITAVTQGLSLQEANLWGNAVAGYKIMHAGARNFPTRSQLEKLIQEHPADK
jgi:sugar/nucleoside kinase (ribokinase family)